MTGSGTRDVTAYVFASPSGTTFHYSAPPEFDYAAGHGVGPTYPVRVRCSHTTAGVPSHACDRRVVHLHRASRVHVHVHDHVLDDVDHPGAPAQLDGDGDPTTTTTGLPDLFVARGSATPTTTTTRAGEASAATSTTPTGSVTPTTAGLLSNTNPLPGDLVAFAEPGFGPGTVVHVELQSSLVPLGDFVVAGDGTGERQARIPANTLAGFHDIVLKGVDPSGAQLVRHLPVLVGSAGTRIPRTGYGNDELLRIALLLVGVGSLAIGRSLVRTSRSHPDRVIPAHRGHRSTIAPTTRGVDMLRRLETWRGPGHDAAGRCFGLIGVAAIGAGLLLPALAEPAEATRQLHRRLLPEVGRPGHQGHLHDLGLLHARAVRGSGDPPRDRYRHPRTDRDRCRTRAPGTVVRSRQANPAGCR